MRYLVNNPDAESGQVLHTEACRFLPFPDKDKISDPEYMMRSWPRWSVFDAKPSSSAYTRACPFCNP